MSPLFILYLTPYNEPLVSPVLINTLPPSVSSMALNINLLPDNCITVDERKALSTTLKFVETGQTAPSALNATLVIDPATTFIPLGFRAIGSL